MIAKNKNKPLTGFLIMERCIKSKILHESGARCEPQNESLRATTCECETVTLSKKGE